MEVCQRCNAKIEDDNVEQVRFQVWDVVFREWLLCQECTQKMRDWVMDFMSAPYASETEPDDTPDPPDWPPPPPAHEMTASELSDAWAKYLAAAFLRQLLGKQQHGG